LDNAARLLLYQSGTMKGKDYNKHGDLIEKVQHVCMTQSMLTLLIWRHTINIF